MQLLLTLSHGQAAVKRGFFVNNFLLQPNLKSLSLVAQKMIYDIVIRTEQPIAKFQVTPELLRSCSLAYRDILIVFNTKQQKVERANEEKEKKQKKKMS